MADFSVQNGLFHFAFLREDEYYLENLFRLSASEYLKRSLYAAGFRRDRLYEITQEGQEFQINGKKMCGQKLLDEAEMFLTMEKGETRKTALWLRFPTFAALAREKEFRQKLAALSGQLKNPRKRNGIFVILIWMEEIPGFQKALEGWTGMFPELSALAAKPGTGFVEELKENMKGCVFVTEDIRRADIQNMLLRNKVLGEFRLGMDELERYGNFIHWYLSSRELQEESGNLLPFGTSYTLSALEKEIRKKKVREEIDAFLKQNEVWRIRIQEPCRFEVSVSDSLIMEKTEAGTAVRVQPGETAFVETESGGMETFWISGTYEAKENGRMLYLGKNRKHCRTLWNAGVISYRNQKTGLLEAWEVKGSFQAEILGEQSFAKRWFSSWANYDRAAERLDDFLLGRNDVEEYLKGQIKAELILLSGTETTRLEQRLEERLNQRFLYDQGVRFRDFTLTLTKRSIEKEDER